MEPGERRDRAGNKRENSKEFTLFIDNLSRDLDNFGLKGVFKRFGLITDAYIPRKTGKNSGRRFGFVRFSRKESAEEALKTMNKRFVRGVRIDTYWEKLQKKRNWKQKRQWRNWEWIPKSRLQPQNQTTQHQQVYQWKRRELIPQLSHQVTQQRSKNQEQIKEGFFAVVQGELCEETTEWLKRSLIGKSKHPLAVASLDLAIKLELPNCLKVTDMGCFKAVLTFESLEVATLAMKDKSDILAYWFDEVKPWNEFESCETGQVWLELYGLPGHGWFRNNIEKVVSNWGELACIDFDTMEVSSFKVARALVDTTQMKTIEGDVLLSLRMQGYRVTVREATYFGVVASSRPTIHSHWFHTFHGQGLHQFNKVQNTPTKEDATLVPDSQSQGMEDEQMQFQNSNARESQQPPGDADQISSSRTHTDPLLQAQGNVETRDALMVSSPTPLDSDSEATVGIIHGI